MYIAICVMLCGLCLGRLARNIAFLGCLDKFIQPAILLLLFLLGLAIGRDERIMESLGSLGLEALLLTIFGMAGSIFCVKLFFSRHAEKISVKNNKN